MALFRKGVAQREIARQCGLSRKTVRRFIRAQGFPERKQRRRTSLVDRHRDYLEMRWQQGCHNSAQLCRELPLKASQFGRIPFATGCTSTMGHEDAEVNHGPELPSLYGVLRGKSPGGS